ncbi:MAG TPA: phosphoenolpyruvate synthase, partial [Methanomicrobia archaeon]|nr:phosphoenolpyruvate synthase [Methanomicrobia archaeon]
MEKENKFVLWFDEIGIKDVGLVGGKNASLGEMYRSLVTKGVNVPGGFAITAYAYKYLIKKTGIENKIIEILSDLDVHDMRNLQDKGKKIRKIISSAEFPEELEEAILEAYHKMLKEDKDITVAVRSSATAEDLPDASFAGQQETYLNIKGDKELIRACKDCFASLFTNRAISYREDKNFDHLNVYLSIGVQKMVRSDLASSGVIFSIDTESGFEKVVFITGSWGLGENVVQGKVNPDEFYVFKPTLKKGYNSIIGKKLGSKEIKMIYTSGMERVKNIETTEEERNSFVLRDEEVLKLAEWAVIIEDHYGKPMDIEWAKDGRNNKLYIVQARPETVHSQQDMNIIKTYKLIEEGKVLAEGQAVGQMIGQGTVNIIKSAKEIEKFKKGEVLVTDMTDPDWEPIMKIAAAIVTNKGGRTCHAAIVSRELGIPCVIGTENGTESVHNGQKVTVSCAEGERGKIYEGLLKFKIDELKLEELPKTKTKIMMNVGIPEKAFIQGQIPCDGVGLAREEFIINSYIGIHPLALINYEELKKSDKPEIKKIVAKIDEKTKAYSDKVQFFIDNLAQGIGKIAAGFYPNDVIVRLSD